jgi:thymidylate synthase (FAD)
VRAWRDVIAKRNHPAADAEIRELARELLRQLKDVAPNSFRDMHAGDE